MKIMMADGKEVSSNDGAVPTYIVTSAPAQDSGAKKGSIGKKHVLFAVSAVVIVVVVLVAILVGVHMFSQAQKEIVKFSLQFKASDQENIKQEVESDPNDNVVMTTVNKAGQVTYIVNDFNRGMQIVKTDSMNGVNCFVSALNRSLAMDPLHITGSDSMTNKGGRAEETFMITKEPVEDRSFLTKKALDMCKGVSLYWVTRQCAQQIDFNSTASGDRTKRGIYRVSPLYGLQGLAGCCKAYWACGVLMFEVVQGNVVSCLTYFQTGNCCTPSSVYPLGVPAPYCYNVYSARHLTPGLICY